MRLLALSILMIFFAAQGQLCPVVQLKISSTNQSELQGFSDQIFNFYTNSMLLAGYSQMTNEWRVEGNVFTSMWELTFEGSGAGSNGMLYVYNNLASFNLNKQGTRSIVGNAELTRHWCPRSGSNILWGPCNTHPAAMFVSTNR